MNLPMGRGRGTAREALAEAALLDDRIGYDVLRAVRDPSGQAVDFVHELVNARAEATAGKPLQGRSQFEAFGAELTLFDTFRELVGTGGNHRSEVTISERVNPVLSGTIVELYARAVGADRIVCQFRDVTAIRAAAASLRREALEDYLTRLPNRRAFLELLERALTRLHRQSGLVGVLYCDLNDFKQVNDRLGHAAGDRLLVHVARRMTETLRPHDVVARYGGDEFLVLCEDLEGEEELLQIAKRLRNRLSGPLSDPTDADYIAPVSVSIGAAATSTPISTELLLSRADAALYAAKASPADGIHQTPEPTSDTSRG